MEYLNATVDQILNFFLRLSGDSSLMIYLLIFAAVFLLVVAIAVIAGGRSPVERRLAGQAVGTLDAGELESLRRKEREGPWVQLLGSLEKHFASSDKKKRTTLQQRMIHAGYMNPEAVRYFYVLRVFSAVGLPGAFLLYMTLVPNQMSAGHLLWFTAVFCAMGLILPRAWLDRKIANRQLSVQESFPDALDMLVVCVEAGLGLDAAFNRVGMQIAPAHPILGEQFGLVALELRAGKSRAEALRGFSDRIGLPEINSFVTLLIQSDSLGTSIAQTLRVHADEMRTNRMLRAEEKAMRLPVLLSIPLVLGILPAMMTVALLPAIIRVIRVLFPVLTGQR